MITCICSSPAVDITYHVDRVQDGATNRVRSVARRPGGKAINVARVLHSLGEPVTVVAPSGGHSGAEFADDLASLGLIARLVRNEAPTRSTVTIVDDAGAATVFVEPAPIDCWPAFLAECAAASAVADAVVISGRIPTGAPPDAVGEVLRHVSGAGRLTFVDTSGPALIEALGARPNVVKSNADELADATGERDVHRAARSLAATYGATVVVTLGADGVFAAAPHGEWHACPAEELSGNPTGAGDALLAGLARGMRRGEAFEDVLRDAVALAAAAVLSPYAGEVDPALYAAQRAGVQVAAGVPR